MYNDTTQPQHVKNPEQSHRYCDTCGVLVAVRKRGRWEVKWKQLRVIADHADVVCRRCGCINRLD